MRVVNRETFLKLPAGTVYAKGVPWSFNSLCFKGESLGNDWYEHDPAWVEANDSGEAFDRLERMLHQGASYPMEDAEGRDGLFDADAIFLIFEKADLEKLRGLIDNAISVTST